MSYFAHIRITDEDGNYIADVSPGKELLISISARDEILIELGKIRRCLEILCDEEIREGDIK